MVKVSGISTRECRLVIKDYGIGLPASFHIEVNNSLGINLMEGLTEQLDG
jgi:two-component sensor histidine kinase